MSKLSDLLGSRNPNRWSAREIGRRAERNGFTMSPASATAIMNGRHGVVTDDLLAAIASVLPVTIEEMRAAQNLPADPGSPWVPHESARHLTVPQRQALDRLIRTIVRVEGEQEWPGSPSPEDTPADFVPPPQDELIVTPEEGLPDAAETLGQQEPDPQSPPAGRRRRPR